MNKIEKQDKIDRYIFDKMEQEEKSKFEQEIANDASLAQEVDNSKRLISAIRQVGQDADQETLKILKGMPTHRLKAIIEPRTYVAGQIKHDASSPTKKCANRFPSNKSTIRHYLPYIAAAAIICFVVIFNVFRESMSEKLYSAYMSPAENEYMTASRGANPELKHISASIKEGFASYDRKEYKEALRQFLSVGSITELKKNPELLFYVAVCQLETTQISDAIDNLRFLSSLRDDFQYSQQVEWYLALAYLKNNSLDKAAPQLQKIITSEGYYADKAKDILQKLHNK